MFIRMACLCLFPVVFLTALVFLFSAEVVTPSAKTHGPVFMLDRVVVTVDPEPEVSQSRLTREQIRVIPGVANDPLRALQTLPGVVAVDASGQLAVRGGGPQDNQYWINNIPWPVPFHFGGLLSTIGGDALDRVDLYSGAFPARWGGNDGAIIDAVTRRDLGSRWGGRIDLNMVLTDIFLEGPVGSVQVSLWGRRTYFDVVAKHFLKSDFTLLPFFWDLGGTASWQASDRHRLKLLVNSTDDQLGLVLKEEDVNQDNQAGEIRFRNRYSTLGINWEYINGGFQSVFTPYLYQFRVDLSGGQDLRFDFKPRNGGFRWDTKTGAGAHEVKVGLGSEWVRTKIALNLPADPSGEGAGVFLFNELRSVTTTVDTVSRFAYLEDTWQFSAGWKIEPGLRFNLPDNRDRAGLGPRLRLLHETSDRRKYYLAWGQYQQAPVPPEGTSVFGNPKLKNRISDHYVAGWEARLRPEMSLRLETYYKYYRRLIVEQPEPLRYDNSGLGRVKGAELLLKWDEGDRLFGWISYSLSKSERKNLYQQGWARYQYDQPHTLSFVGSYELNQRWRIGTSAIFHSGPLVTPVVGRYYDPIEDRWFPLLGREFSERLPYYLRMDARMDYTWFFDGWDLSLYVEILNVLNRVNVQEWEYNETYSDRKEQGRIPFLPYLGIRTIF